MKRFLIAVVVLLTLALGLYFFNEYWIHRYDTLIERHASVYRLDPDLVWSVIYEETYFSPWKNGKDGEIGLMQITPLVGREWAAATGMKELERQMSQDPASLLRDPQRNIQVGSWYLEKVREPYRDSRNPEARMIAAYNAGPSRAADWNRRSTDGRPLTEAEFINNINIPSTKSYVLSILGRYRSLKARAQATRP